jgi:thymidylate synthase
MAEVITSQVLERRFDLEQIRQVAPKAKHPLFNDVPCDYGIRMGNQLEDCIARLRADKYSRRAKITFSRPDDEIPPCIMEVQFFIRDHLQNSKLSPSLSFVITVAYMRSWDLVLGLPYDVHLFQALGKHVAETLGVQQGEVVVFAGSAHTYF